MQIKIEYNKCVFVWSVSEIFTALDNQYPEKYIIVLLVGTKKLRFAQKLQGVIFDPLLSVLGVIGIFSG